MKAEILTDHIYLLSTCNQSAKKCC